MKSNKIVLIPTGDEVMNGTVRDTDSPMMKDMWLKWFPSDTVHICDAVEDSVEAITCRIAESMQETDIIVLIGGSGGGHRHDSDLGKDFTHTAMDDFLDPMVGKSIYGSNGHMWCRLIAGFSGNTFVINVPGPFEEAKAAFTAFCAAFEESGMPAADSKALVKINDRMTEAVIGTYGM